MPGDESAPWGRPDSVPGPVGADRRARSDEKDMMSGKRKEEEVESREETGPDAGRA